MKKIIIGVCLIVTMLLLVSCGSNTATQTDTQPETEEKSTVNSEQSKDEETFELASKTWKIDIPKDESGEPLYDIGFSDSVTFVNEEFEKSKEEYIANNPDAQVEYYSYKDNGETEEITRVDHVGVSEGIASLGEYFSDEGAGTNQESNTWYYGIRIIVNKDDRSDAVSITARTAEKDDVDKMVELLMSAEPK